MSRKQRRSLSSPPGEASASQTVGGAVLAGHLAGSALGDPRRWVRAMTARRGRSGSEVPSASSLSIAMSSSASARTSSPGLLHLELAEALGLVRLHPESTWARQRFQVLSAMPRWRTISARSLPSLSIRRPHGAAGRSARGCVGVASLWPSPRPSSWALDSHNGVICPPFLDPPGENGGRPQGGRCQVPTPHTSVRWLSNRCARAAPSRRVATMLELPESRVFRWVPTGQD